MKILHLCLANFYIDNYNYQENVLPRINKEDGHDVRILASTATFTDNLDIGFVEPSEYMTEYGVPIKRLPYVKTGPDIITWRIRKYPNVYEEIAAFAPDVIMAHALSFWSVLDVIRYKKEHPEVKFYADTHTAAYNSGRNWITMYVLHRGVYRWLIQKALPYLDKYFYIGISERDFSREHYGIPLEMMEFLPLGGNLLEEEEYRTNRTVRRKELKLEENELLLLHSGKMDAMKRTKELLEAFSAVSELKAKLVIIGSIAESEKQALSALMEADPRVVYLGWKQSSELLEYLCACDLYCQPGSVSATMQNAICYGCPVMAYPHAAYTEDLDFGNILWVKTCEDMEDTFRNLAAGRIDMVALRKGSERCARELLDYRMLAARLYR